MLTDIVNESFSQGIFPEKLKHAVVRPIYKKGRECEVENYRPITLVSVFSKILESLMYTRLKYYLKCNNIITSSQHGFREGSSTHTALQAFLTEVIDNMDKRNYPVGIFCDLSKAFDCVDYKILLHKLYRYGLRGASYNWFQSYMADRTQVVEISYKDPATGVMYKERSSARINVAGVP
jgi:hypothetical protein